ncbi:MAG: hypothetical protein ABI247_14670 [Rhodanobacter sp.]
MKDITVTLNRNANPPVTCEPQQQNVENGKRHVKWSKGGSDQGFSFFELVIDDVAINGNFSQIPYYEEEKWVVDDNNSIAHEYFYELKVKALDGTIYSTKKKPNKIRGGGGGGGDPSIKNN